MRKKLIIMDLDGTVTESKSKISKEMSSMIKYLLGAYRVAVISGGSYSQFQNQFLVGLNNLQFPEMLEALYLLPCSGAQFYIFKTLGYEQVYNNDFNLREKVEIYQAFYRYCGLADIEFSANIYGEIAEDRGSQITFSMCGQEAPLNVKQTWDINGEKRKKLISYMKPCLPEFEVKFGGTTSIDVTKKGIDKEFGIKKLIDYLIKNDESLNSCLNLSDIVFIGDRLEENGNDYPAKRMGLECIPVSGPTDTLKVLESISS